MNKKIKILLLLGALTSCGNVNNNSSQEKTSLIGVMQNINYYDAYQAEIEVDNKSYQYYVDGNSFFDNITQHTYFKLLFSEYYFIYNKDVIIDEQYSIENNCFNEFKVFFDINLLHQNFLETSEDCYVLIDSKLEDYKFSFMEENPNYISLNYNRLEEKILIDYKSETKNIKFKFSPSTYRIYYFDKKLEDYNNFYEKTNKTYDEVLKLLDDKENFVLILTSDSCSSCRSAQSLYAEFTYEYPNKQRFYSINIRRMDINKTKTLISTFKNTYDLQETSFKYPEYDKYPDDTFLTPTAIRYENGLSKYVLLSFSISLGDLFYKLSFE